MILSDSALVAAIAAGELTVVGGYEEQNLQPASIDLHLGSHFARWKTTSDVINLAKHHSSFPPMEHRSDCSDYVLAPRDFVLATTREYVKIGSSLVGRVEGRSSLGRLGLVVHATAGFIDPGFQGHITLELYNQSPHDIVLVAGQGICQLAIEQVYGNVRRLYGNAELGSKYFAQEGVTTSRWKGSNVG
jgi:dCTP deaminase